jgi:hypothetical protein
MSSTISERHATQTRAVTTPRLRSVTGGMLKCRAHSWQKYADASGSASGGGSSATGLRAATGDGAGERGMPIAKSSIKGAVGVTGSDVRDM